MGYPKKMMSISQLMEIGMPERMLYELAHMPRARAVMRRGRGGKFLFDTDKLDDDIEIWKQINARR